MGLRAPRLGRAMAQLPEYEEDRSRVDVTLVSVLNAWHLGAIRAAEILRAADVGESPLYDVDYSIIKWPRTASTCFDHTVTSWE